VKPLIIVESPAKAKTIERFLGRRFTVRASKGHVRDLPKSQFGVDIEHGFAPKYITIRGKGEIVKELREAVRKADRVYLATDPDREGEAISWHLAQLLGIPEEKPCRIVFHEVTKDAVTRALKEARPINEHLVDAQQARRVLDRLVGYQLSPLLWRKVRRGLSAGRVQSVAVRLIVDRERERRAFVPEEYWTVEARLRREDGTEFDAVHPVPGEDKARLGDGARAEALARAAMAGPFTVRDVRRRERRRNAPAPFTTSTLQQEAARRLGFSVRKTMSLAQMLYEGVEIAGEGQVGLVTYIRTDSTRVAAEAADLVHRYVSERFGPAFAEPAARKERRAVGVQGAHEAIRPTDVRRTPDMVVGSLTPDQAKLYRLIWERFVASAMSPAVLEVQSADLEGGGALFRATGSRILFPGFLALVHDAPVVRGEERGADDEETGKSMPELVVGEQVVPVKVEALQHFTEPPPRFTEAMLVRALEEKGIGRPSTYAPIIQTIQERGYVRREDRRLVPTELGELVVDLLKEHFPEVVDPEFTADLEEKLDRIEEGDEEWQRVLREFYGTFRKDLERAEAEIGTVSLPEEETDVICERCGRRMVVKHGRFGKFLACPGFPECRNTKPYVEPTGAKCPRCGGDIVERRTRSGRRFYGCSNYPSCDFTTWQRPTARTCPLCGTFLVEKRTRQGMVYACAREGCGYEEHADGGE
jgi:DNA topoisomerase-1